MALSVTDREAFLAQPHIAALAVSGGHDRAPVTVPVWYSYAPGEELWFHTGRDSVKGRRLAETGRCTLLVQSVTPSVRYVSVEGTVSITEATEADIEQMARRYLPPETVEGYVAMAAAEHGPQVRVTVSPERWRTADIGTF